MSVIIKGMDMPKACMHCPMFNGIGCKSTMKMFDELTNVAVRVQGCQLVALSDKHGRLIDADRLIARLENEMRSGLYADTEKDEETKKFVYAIHKLFIEQIQAEETVIEAEQGAIKAKGENERDDK